ncbi:MAG: NADPH:quinone oxidoreductase family protein [Thermoleophilaceae bacterium]
MSATPDTVLARPTRAFELDAFGGPEVLKLVERPTQPPGRGEMLVDVEAAGVNFGDVMIRRGEYLRDQPLSMAPGCEAVGRVALAGEGADIAPGTRVAAWVEAGGAYASRVIAPAGRVYPVPEDVPAAAIVAVFFQGTTADFALHRYGRLSSDETVLVHGAAGGVGGLAVQLAKHDGARVVATASSAEKREIAREHGADVVLDSADPDALLDRLMEATDGHGCDVVVDGVGGPMFEPSLRALAFGGRYVIAGSASQQPAMLDARRLLPRAQTVCGFILARISEEDPGEPARTLLRLCDLVREGALKPRCETLPLERAPEVHLSIENRTLAGKVVLNPDPNGGERA